MLKTAGIFLILAAGTGLGYTKSKELTERERNLRAFMQSAAYLQGAVRCGNAGLSEAFRETGKRMEGVYREFLFEAADRMEETRGLTFEEIYRETADRCFPSQAFSIRERAIIYGIGEKLGCFDREMQLRQLEGVEKELSQALMELRKELPQRKKLCQSLGILGGILLGVLLW